MDRRIVGVLFDIDILEAQSESGNYGVVADRIVFRALDPRKMEQVMFLSGDVDVPSARRSYSFCIAVEESRFLTGHAGIKHFVGRLTESDEPGLFPKGKRFIESPPGLVPTGNITIDGRLELCRYGLSCLRTATEEGWRVLPEPDFLGSFAADYARAIEGREICSDVGLYHNKEWQALYLSALQEAGCKQTMRAIERLCLHGLSDQEKDHIQRVLAERIWPQDGGVRLGLVNQPHAPESDGVARQHDAPGASSDPSPSPGTPDDAHRTNGKSSQLVAFVGSVVGGCLPKRQDVAPSQCHVDGQEQDHVLDGTVPSERFNGKLKMEGRSTGSAGKAEGLQPPAEPEGEAGKHAGSRESQSTSHEKRSVLDALVHRNPALARECIASGGDLFEEDEYGGIPIHYAAAYGYLDLIDEFVKRGVSLDIRNSRGATPLFYAMDQGQIEAGKRIWTCQRKTLQHDGSAFWRAVEELCTIGVERTLSAREASSGFLQKNEKKEYIDHARAREIGTQLDAMGGITLMRQTFEAVRSILGSRAVRDLSQCWDKVGSWMD